MDNTCYIIVDLQEDFFRGSLANPEAVKIIPNLIEKINSIPYDTAWWTADTHNNNYLKTREGQFLPIKHCMDRKNGGAFLKELFLDELPATSIRVLEKNTFGYRYWDIISPVITQKTKIEIFGVVTDICVLTNAILLQNLFPENEIIIDVTCCAGTSPAKHLMAIEVMRGLGMTIKE